MGKILTFTSYAILAIVLTASVVLILPVYRKYVKTRRDVTLLQENLDRVRTEYTNLQQEVHDLEHKSSAIEKVAREEYHLCREGEIIYLYNQ